MPDNMAQASIEKLALGWPPERISALETATDPTEIRAGAFALREALMLCSIKREQPRPPAFA